MSSLIKIIILAFVQGVAEFLPISSSGHLSIIQNIFNIYGEESLLVSVVLHAGTLVAILIFYFKEINSLFYCQKRKIIILLIVGSIPAGILGICIKETGLDKFIFSNMYIPGFGLLLTAVILKFGINKNISGGKKIEDLSVRDSIFIGTFQAFAIFPGISRSGSTISGGLIKKLKSTEAATFSFLLAIPAIAGAAFIEIITHFYASNTHSAYQVISYSELVLGFFVSAIVGYFSLKILINILKKNKLNIFAYYCFILGIIVIWGNLF